MARHMRKYATLLALVLTVASVNWILIVDLAFGKTVHVRGYYRKDGTYVRPHTRSSPGSGATSRPTYDFTVPVAPRTDHRSEARTTYRTAPPPTSSGGLQNEDLVRETPAVAPAAKILLTAHYLLVFKSGAKHEIVSFTEDDAAYRCEFTTGGTARIPKNLVDRIEPITAQ
jgi:hypothetical protein